VAVVAARIVREAEARLVPQLVRRGRADAAAEPAAELRARRRSAAVDVRALSGRQHGIREDVEADEAHDRRGIRHARRSEVHHPAVRRVFHSDRAFALARFAEAYIELLERRVKRGKGDVFDSRLLRRRQRVAGDAPCVGEGHPDVNRRGRAAGYGREEQRGQRKTTHLATREESAPSYSRTNEENFMRVFLTG